MEPSDSPNYVAKPPEHERYERLSRLRLNPGDISTMPLMVKSGQHFVISANNPMARNWLRPFPELSTLDDLKHFIGVPDHVFRSTQVTTQPTFPDVHHSSLQVADALELLDQTRPPTRSRSIWSMGRRRRTRPRISGSRISSPR